MFTLKPLSKDAIPSALAKAERYRLLNEPGEAESICLDVLQVDPDNQDALITLLLALTDQFPHESSLKVIGRAVDLAARLKEEYDRAYYSGIIRERRAKAVLHHERYGAAAAAVEWLREAMAFFERAETISPARNDDAVLRWNACARLMMSLPETVPELPQPEPLQLE
jgi:tetratricopeptide (TPR) repeat protein